MVSSRLKAALPVLVLSLAACGGGGSSPSVPNSPIVTPTGTPVVSGPTPTVTPTVPPSPGTTTTPAPPSVTPTPGATPAALPGATTAPGLAIRTTQALSIAASTSAMSNLANMLNVSSPSSFFGRSSAAAAAPLLRRAGTTPCQNYQTITVQSSSGSSGGGATAATYLLQGFHDSACTQLEYELSISMAATNSLQAGIGILHFLDPHTGNALASGNLYLASSSSPSAFSMLEQLQSKDTLTSAEFYGICESSGCTAAADLDAEFGFNTSDFMGISFASVLNSVTGSTPVITADIGAVGTLAVQRLTGSAPPFLGIAGTPAPTPMNVKLENVTANGYTIVDVTDQATINISTSPTSTTGQVFVTGISGPVASFSVDKFGFGSLNAAGVTYPMAGFVVLNPQ